MGTSFLLGEQTADPADHLLIALVDQPALTRATVGRLLASHPDLVDEVDCSDQSTGEDIDTPDQLGLLG